MVASVGTRAAVLGAFVGGALIGAAAVAFFLWDAASSSSSKASRKRSEPSLQAEYKQHHAAVWPEMQQALQRTGWHNYSLFMRPDGVLVGTFETESTLRACLDGMEKEEVNARWQKHMAKFFPAAGSLRPDQMMTELEEVMHLPI